MLVSVISANVVDAFEHFHHIFRGIEYGSNDEHAKQKIEQKRPLVENTNKLLVPPLSTDLVREPNVQTADEQVAEDKGKYGCHSHADCDESAVAATPPHVDDYDCVAQYLADGGGKHRTEQVLPLLLLPYHQ